MSDLWNSASPTLPSPALRSPVLSRPSRSEAAAADDGARRSRAASTRRRWPAPLVAAAVVAAIAALGWIRWTEHLAAGDIGHFVRDRLWSELPHFFGYGLTGAGSGSYEVARALELPFWGIGRLLGSEAVGQGLFYVTLGAATAAAGAFLASRVTRRRRSAVLAGIVAAINPLTLTSFPNPNTLLATAVLATVAGLLLRPARRHDPLVLALATLPASYLAVNPPTLVVLATGALVAAVAATCDPAAPGWRETLMRFARALPWLLLLHAWWIVPQAVVLLGGGAEVSQSVTSVDNWSWAHRNNSLGRLVTLNAHWAWDDPSYFPYAAALNRPAWSWTAYVLPAGAAIGALLSPRGRRRTTAVWLVAAVVSLVFAAGLHAPFESLGRWFYATLPGWWLFREPVTKWGILALVAYLPLFAAGIDRLTDAAHRLTRTGARRTATATVLAFAVLPVLYPWPLLTGAVAPTERPTLPPARSAVPAEWEDVAARLNADPGSGKVLLLPVPSFYQTSTSWGFHGVPNVPLQSIRRPVIAPGNGGYFTDATDTIGGLARRAQDAILAGDHHVARRALQALGATDVLLRRDQRAGPGQPLSAEPAELYAALEGAPWASAVHRGELAATFAVVADPDARTDGRVTTYAGGVRADDLAELDVSTTAAAQGPGTALLSGVRTGGTGLPSIAAATLRPGDAATELPDGTTLAAVRTGPTWYHATLDDRVLEVAHRTTLPGRPDPPATTPLRGDVVALEGPAGTEPFEGELTFAVSATGSMRALVAEQTQRLALDRAVLGDCLNLDDRPLHDVAISRRDRGRGTVLQAAEHSACLMVDLPTLRDGDGVTVPVRSVDGSPARACLFHDETQRCLDTVSSRTPERLLLRPTSIPDSGELTLYLYADGEAAPSTIAYDEPAVVSLTSVPVRLPEPPARRRIDGPVAVPDPGSTWTVGDPGPLEDCSRVDDRSMAETRISDRRLDDGAIELHAGAHAACVAYDVGDLVPGAVIDVRVPAERLRGAPPRLCVWADGPDTCLTTATLEVGAGEAGTIAVRTEVPLAVSRLRIYVYADGAGEPAPTTIARYARPVVVADPGVRWVVTRSEATDDPPAPTVDQHRPGRLTVSLAAADEPFVLTVADADADDWALEGLGERLLGRATVDGYAPGWLIAPGPATTVAATHRTSAAVGAFHTAWAAAAFATALAYAAAAHRRRRRRRDT